MIYEAKSDKYDILCFLPMTVYTNLKYFRVYTIKFLLSFTKATGPEREKVAEV